MVIASLGLQGRGIAEMTRVRCHPPAELAFELRVADHHPEPRGLLNMIESFGQTTQAIVVLIHGTSRLPCGESLCLAYPTSSLTRLGTDRGTARRWSGLPAWFPWIIYSLTLLRVARISPTIR